MKKIVTTLSFLIFMISFLFAQPFTHDDTLRGSNGPGRDWWDVMRYDLFVKPNIEDKTIEGQVNILFKTKSEGDKTMQIDLQEPLIIDKILFENATVNFKKSSSNTWSLFLKDIMPKMYMDHVDGGKGWTMKDQTIIIYYHGKPHEAVKPPWDGGWVWTKDKNGTPWASVACQSTGASIWYPCKDYQGDEPDDGASITITVPNTLTAVSNGRLISKIEKNDSTISKWEIKNPINNYNLIPYIGKYVNFSEVYKAEKGNLTMNYWVLDYNLKKAKKQFSDATRTMKALEYWFGPYPFYEDGYKLIEAPYLGMEHQSGIAYGNGYQNGYYGRDLSESGWGMKWDFIIVHESAHEWFGNNITSKDIADMWIHEAFANYSETLFTEYYYGKQAANQYVQGIRGRIVNDVPVIGPYGVNKEGSTDMYYKGGNMLHTIRQIINNDEKFRMLLRGMNKTFYHQTVTTKQIEQYINQQSGIDFSKVFDQYLRTVMVPILEYKIQNGKLSYRWTNCVKGFSMPVEIRWKKDEYSFIYPTQNFKELKTPLKEIKVDENFYINVKRL